MPRPTKRRALDVAMNGVHVGTWHHLTSEPDRFDYATSWLDADGAIPMSLSLPLSPHPHTGDVVRNFFDNLLPDNRQIRERLEGRLGARSNRPFDLLESIGADCVGALQLYTPGQTPPDVHQVCADPVGDAEIAETLRSYRDMPLGMQRGGEFRISIAGAQEKTAWLWHEDRWQRPRGTTPTSHIFKLPIGPLTQSIDLSDSVENEWLCLRIVAAFGLPVANATMLAFEDRKVLAVERFDRRWSRDRSWLVRVPQEDTCQALGEPSARKYEADGGPGVQRLMTLLLQTVDPDADRERFFATQILFWLLAAIDGHAKNFSLFLHAGGRSNLTPTYDVLSAHPIVANGQLHPHRLKMAMAVTGKNRHYGWDQIRGRHWLTTADAARFPRRQARAILERFADEGEAALQRVQDELPDDFPPHVADPIFAGVRDTIARIGTLD